MSERDRADGRLGEWQDAIRGIKCPWPGPKPIESESNQLRGRLREVADLAASCLTNDLVVIRGDSGVGKSSLLMSGLIPELEKQNIEVLYCNKWDGEVGSWPEAAQHVVDHAKVSTGPENPFAGPAMDLASRFPDRLVIVLDQFEEAIRNSPWLAHHTLKWIEEAAGVTSIRFVVSLRSEHEHELAGLLTKPFARRERREIKPITDARAIRLIIAGKPGEAMPIDADATDLLLEAWEASQEPDVATAWDRAGLLHLQAALFDLWMLPRDDPEMITKGDVEKLLTACAEERAVGEHDAVRGLLGYALEKSVEISVDLCVKACSAVDVPTVVVNQARWIFREVTGHLSSGGYKTPQHMWELAERVIGLGGPSICAAVRRIVEPIYYGPDWLGVQRSDHLRELLAIPGQGKQLGSGAAAGLHDAEVMFELYRCYFLALEWLTTFNIARLARGTTGRFVTLSHDRYERGLKAWRRREAASFKEAVEQLTSLRGEDLSWPDVGSYREHLTPNRTADHALVAIAAGQRLVVNVNWRSCTISDTDFTDVVFVSCDFLGTTFEGCTFQGATFVNCVLDQVDFVSCRVVGAAQYPREELLGQIKKDASMLSDPPTFSIDVPVPLARSLGALRTDAALPAAERHAHLVVGESGVPARPMAGPAEERDVRAFAALPIRSGGLSMCGGRLSSLTFRRCAFDGELDKVSLRHVAGSSLEICEQRSGTFDLFGAGIRALAVTRPVDDLADPAPETAPPPRPFLLQATQVRVVNAWFGARLRGTATFTKSKIWNAINASEDDFTVDIDDCQYYGLVNTGQPKNSGMNSDFTINGLGASAEEVLEFSRNVDFRESVAGGQGVGAVDG